jgi:hypothetical protein
MIGGAREAVSRLLRDAIGVYHDDPVALSVLEDHARRLDEPLRIAVAGMVKAGKSTLINALLGEDIAPTDTAECTRFVTWYRYRDVPRATVYPVGGEPRPVTIEQHGDRVSFDIGALPVEEVERVEVEWPAEGLRDLIVIDTPGIASLSGELSLRSNRFLVPASGPSQADAVIYVLRHMHETDLNFLKSFRETASIQHGPVNALAVLSRADEIGAGRIDSLLAARNVAERYRSDENLRSLAMGVLPVAGRLAQTARTLQQSELSALVELTGLDRKDRELLLISADRFVQPREGVDLNPETRAALLDRFGLFGIRLATVLIASGFSELKPLARELARRSGLDDLQDLVDSRFRMRARYLKVHAALAGIETLLRERPHAGTRGLTSSLERIEADTHEVHELRLLATAQTTGIALAPGVKAEMLRLVGAEGISAAERLGLRQDSSLDEMRTLALSHVRRWRRRAEHPLTDRATAELCRIVVRSCEAIVVQAGGESAAAATSQLSLTPEPGTGARKKTDDQSRSR